MLYILPILTPYRYPILAALSLLLLAEMTLAAVNLIPIEYEGALGWLTFFTIVAWAGIAVVIGVAAPAGGDAPKRRGHIIWILSPALFAMLVLLAIRGENIFQAQFLLYLIQLPYLLVLVMVWIGMVVIVGATANVEHSKKTYLIMNVLPLSMLTQIMLSGPAGYLLNDLFTPVAFLLNSLVIGAVLRRTVLPDKSWIILAMISLGISVVSFVPATVLVVLLIASMGGFGTCNDCPGLAIGLFTVVLIVIPVLLSLTFSVPLAVLVGGMSRPIRNITVAGIGMAAMILVFVWYYLYLLPLATM